MIQEVYVGCMKAVVDVNGRLIFASHSPPIPYNSYQHMQTDSTFNYLHWDMPNLPILADEWIGLQIPEEPIAVPEEYDAAQNDDDSEVKITLPKRSKKQKWDHNPMEE